MNPLSLILSAYPHLVLAGSVSEYPNPHSGMPKPSLLSEYSNSLAGQEGGGGGAGAAREAEQGGSLSLILSRSLFLSCRAHNLEPPGLIT